MDRFKFSQMILAGGVMAASLIGYSSVAAGGPSVSTPSVACASGGVLSTVTDENGVQQQACVAVGDALVPPTTISAATVQIESAVAVAVDTDATSAPVLPQTGSGDGSLVIAALLVGSGSVASIVSRRKR